jgi:hypothetical protein
MLHARRDDLTLSISHVIHTSHDIDLVVQVDSGAGANAQKALHKCMAYCYKMLNSAGWKSTPATPHK